MCEKKTEARSIRMTKTVCDFVCSYGKSNGFNQKFEDLIMFCMVHENEIESKINDKKKQLDYFDKKINEKRSILASLEIISNEVESIIVKQAFVNIHDKNEEEKEKWQK